jgi:hypothetical protein
MDVFWGKKRSDFRYTVNECEGGLRQVAPLRSYMSHRLVLNTYGTGIQFPIRTCLTHRSTMLGS